MSSLAVLVPGGSPRATSAMQKLPAARQINPSELVPHLTQPGMHDEIGAALAENPQAGGRFG